MAWNAERSEDMRQHRWGEMLSRRFFLRAGLSAAAALVLPACSRRGESDEAARGGAPEDVLPEPELIPAPPTSEPLVRVRLRSLMPTQSAVEIGPSHAWLRVTSPKEGRTLAVLRGPLRVTRSEGAWSVVDERGFTPWMTDAVELDIRPLRDDEPLMLVDGKAYPGTIMLHARLDQHADAFDLVNHVPMEAYLPGVLVRELFNHWHLETHTAQAVAARSYASMECVFWRSRRHFDVTNTQASQVYDGLTAHETSLEAVRATRGVVMAYHDQLVPGYYSSSCGGLAARAVDVIGPNPINDVPPLEGRSGEDACTGIEQVRWSATHVMSELVQRMQQFGRAHKHTQLADLGSIRNVELSETNQHGRPTRFAIETSSSHAIEILAEELRRAANFSDEQAGGSSKDRLWSSFVDPRAGATRITFHGKGRGHGAGLCQYGAEMFARGGMQAFDILSWYYPGVSIVGSYS